MIAAVTLAGGRTAGDAPRNSIVGASLGGEWPRALGDARLRGIRGDYERRVPNPRRGSTRRRVASHRCCLRRRSGGGCGDLRGADSKTGGGVGPKRGDGPRDRLLLHLARHVDRDTDGRLATLPIPRRDRPINPNGPQHAVSAEVANPNNERANPGNSTRLGGEVGLWRTAQSYSPGGSCQSVPIGTRVLMPQPNSRDWNTSECRSSALPDSTVMASW